MKAAIFSVHGFDKPFLEQENSGAHELTYCTERLVLDTAHLAKGHEAVALLTSDTANAEVLERLRSYGVRYIALRSVGHDHVDLIRAAELKMNVANVPAYSPHSIAEHAVAMMLALNRKLILADNRVKRHDFHLDGLTGFDMNGRTVGIIGTGKIGAVLAKILHGFGCHLLCHDKTENPSLVSDHGARYTDLDALCKASDIITLNLPLNAGTRYLINERNIALMKHGVMLINTARGAIVDTQAVLSGIYTGRISAFGMDVYEHEKDLFFYDRSDEILQDKTLALLTTFSNVLITAHQAFLTEEALAEIGRVTIANIDQWARSGRSENDL